MSTVSFDYNTLKTIIWGQLELDEVKASIKRLEGIDWNPFDEDGDQYNGVFAEIQHNWELVWDVVLKVVAAVQHAIVDGVELSNPEKHKVAVDLLDDLLRVPWFLEPFDGIILDMLVKSAVAHMKAVNWTGVELPADLPAKVAFKEVG